MQAIEALRAAAHEWLGDTPVQAILREFALSIQAIRLYECGFESTINDYSAAELLLLAHHMAADQRTVVIIDAMSRADDRLRDLLAKAGLIEVAHG